MKSFLSFLFFLFNLFSVTAQTWSQDARWWYQKDEFFSDPLPEYVRIKKIGDTLIQNRDCSILRSQIIDYQAGAPVTYLIQEFILCQEGDKIWYFEPFDATFYSLYDFSKTAGDTFHTYTGSYDPASAGQVLTMRVDSVSTINVSGVVLRTQWVTQLDGTPEYFMQGQVIERIGWTFYLLPQYALSDPPVASGLLCFKDSTFSYPEGSSCNLVAAEEPVQAEAFSVFPNPTSGWITMETPGFLEIQIFDRGGRLKLNRAEDSQIDLTHLPDGLYWIKAIYPQGFVYQKLIKFTP